MPKREYVQQAKHYDHQNVGGYFASEKLDGIRCIWDGGISRGLPYDAVPYCNTAKLDRFKVAPIATGLWTRYGKPIVAPDWWLDQMPPILCDGELWSERGEFQVITGIVKKQKPLDHEWKRIKFMAYGLPVYRYWLVDGRICDKKHIDLTLRGDVWRWAWERCRELNKRCIESAQNWKSGQQILRQYPDNDVYKVHEQIALSHCPTICYRQLQPMMDDILAKGGEGMMLVDPDSYWKPERVGSLLKWKGILDDEATVVGYIWGKETDIGGKFLGMLGSLVLDWRGKRFNLSGFTNEERRMRWVDSKEEAQTGAVGYEHQGEPVSDDIEAMHFPRGSQVTFKYRELSEDGIPKDARYLRPREDL